MLSKMSATGDGGEGRNARYSAERQEGTPVGSGRRNHFVEPAKAESKFREITNVYSLQNTLHDSAAVTLPFSPSRHYTSTSK